MELSKYIEKHGNKEVDEKQLNQLLGIKQSKVWIPKNNEIHYYINSTGDVLDDTWNDFRADEEAYAIGNCFKTKEEAEFMVERLKVIAEMKRYALEHNECELDWNDISQDKWNIVYFNQADEIYYLFDVDCKRNDIYFTSKEIAMDCVKAIGEDRIKKYYLQVED